MTTETIETRQAGVNAWQTALGEVGGTQNPACAKLKAALGAYQSAETELDEARGKLAKAENNMSELGDEELSEVESLRAISNAHGRKELYASRIATFERKTAGLLKELRSALLPAYNEVRGVVILETERRIEIIERRVIEACGGLVEHSVTARGMLGALARQSRPVWAAQRHLPGQMIGLGGMAGEAVVAQSHAVLGNLEQIIAEFGREI